MKRYKIIKTQEEIAQIIVPEGYFCKVLNSLILDLTKGQIGSVAKTTTGIRSKDFFLYMYPTETGHMISISEMKYIAEEF